MVYFWSVGLQSVRPDAPSSITQTCQYKKHESWLVAVSWIWRYSAVSAHLQIILVGRNVLAQENVCKWWSRLENNRRPVPEFQGSIHCRRARCFISTTPRAFPYAFHDYVDSYDVELDRGRLIWVVTTQHSHIIHKTPALARDRTNKICRSFHHLLGDYTLYRPLH